METLLQQAAIQKAAFEQKKEEGKEMALAASTSSLKRTAEESSQLQGRQLPKRQNFRAQNVQHIPCRTWLRSGSCTFGDSCRFGHFTPDASIRPTGGNAQPLPSQASSYTSGIRRSQSGFNG